MKVYNRQLRPLKVKAQESWNQTPLKEILKSITFLWRFFSVSFSWTSLLLFQTKQNVIYSFTVQLTLVILYLIYFSVELCGYSTRQDLFLFLMDCFSVQNYQTPTSNYTTLTVSCTCKITSELLLISCLKTQLCLPTSFSCQLFFQNSFIIWMLFHNLPSFLSVSFFSNQYFNISQKKHKLRFLLD